MQDQTNSVMMLNVVLPTFADSKRRGTLSYLDILRREVGHPVRPED